MTITDVQTVVSRGPENSDLRRIVSEKLEKKGSRGPWLWWVYFDKFSILVVKTASELNDFQ